ncbi:hypothetical protein BKA70DRAFT_1239210 [Coprinopsis sp. MPI-PUGE-AT-0042]|nr:hypothetical protein BKA70DRAFT_1239210 [Coprinopsis sp. MPI-PUGE-AT-0042]
MASKTLLFTLAASLPLALGATFDVAVGPGGELVFDPPTVEATPKSHSATQSTFDTPCAPLADGFSSQVVTTEAEGEEVRPFTIPTDYDGTAPIWFYCGVGQHCQNGMVFAVNAPAAPSNRSFEAFQAAARGEAPPSASASGSPSGSASGSPSGSSTRAAGSGTSSAGAPGASNSGAPSGDDDGAASSLGAGAGLLPLWQVSLPRLLPSKVVHALLYAIIPS